VRTFFDALKATPVRDVIAAELLRRPDTDPAKLNGAGLAIINPPYGFEDEAAPILEACVRAFGEAGASAGVERIINE